MIYLFMNKKCVFLCFFFKLSNWWELMFVFPQFARIDFRRLKIGLLA